MATKSDRHKTVKTNCKNCGKEFEAREERIKQGMGQFCSKKCLYEYRRSDVGKKENNQYLGKENAKKSWDSTKKSYFVYWIDPETLKRKTTSYAHWWWEMNKGEIPFGYTVGYKDGNFENISPDNFYLKSPIDRGKEITQRQLGSKMSNEAKKKLSIAHTGKKLSDEHKKKIGENTKQLWMNGVFDDPKIRESYSENGKRNFGRSFSDETKRKMAISHLGKRHPNSNSDKSKEKRRISHLGHIHSEDTKKKLSEKMKNRVFSDLHIENLKKTARKGDQSNFWRGGKFSTEYPLEFSQALKSKVRRRDGFVCKSCGKNLYKNPYSAVHHIDADKNNNSMDNLVLLCKTCHGLVHNGQSNGNSFIEMLKGKLV